MNLYPLIRPLLFRLEPERAQSVALAALGIASRLLRQPVASAADTARSVAAVDLMGLRFANRVGLAAGFDKSARHLNELGALGFGCIEVGTVTPRPQPGNPPPNLFRLVEDRALINRMGFNNDGVDAVVRRLEARRYRGICGVNIGKNAGTALENAAADYVACLRAVYAVADYVAVNISSPNTPGLRELQEPDALRALLSALAEAREALSGVHRKRVPMLVKVAPDLDEADLDAIVDVLRGSGVDGVIATNTTTTRPPSLRSRHAPEAGGLSGEPLHSLSVRVIRALRARLGAGYPIVGVGGIMSAEAGRATFAAGANVIQLYTGLVYEGPGLVSDLSAGNARAKAGEGADRGA